MALGDRTRNISRRNIFGLDKFSLNNVTKKTLTLYALIKKFPSSRLEEKGKSDSISSVLYDITMTMDPVRDNWWLFEFFEN